MKSKSLISAMCLSTTEVSRMNLREVGTGGPRWVSFLLLWRDKEGYMSECALCGISQYKDMILNAL